MQSFEEVLQQVDNLHKNYIKLSEMLTYEEVFLDKKLCLNIEKQKQTLQPLVDKYEIYLQHNKNLQEINSLNNLDVNEIKIFEEEKQKLNKEIVLLQNEIKKLYLDINAKNQSVIIEIVKSKEILSDKLCEDLLSCYNNFCKQNNLKINAEKQKDREILNISGFNAMEYFKEESGEFVALNQDKKGSCMVFVYNTTGNKEIAFKEEDIKITTCRSSGAGGQHINKTDSSIRATHIPTNLSAVSQDERSQFQNKQKAIERLKQKVLSFALKQKDDLILKQKKILQQEIKAKKEVREINYQTQKVKFKNQEILLTDFLSGKIL